MSAIPLMLTANFNSQPREGGWREKPLIAFKFRNFNSQPREGGWVVTKSCLSLSQTFQLTAARRRLGGGTSAETLALQFQLTAARRRLANFPANIIFHATYFNSQPREGGWARIFVAFNIQTFQLTAARRRLAGCQVVSLTT